MKEQSNRDALTVSQLNECIRSTLENSPLLREVFVQGEISGAKLYASGHFYFSLKDSDSVISAVMFKGQYTKLRFTPENGMKVIMKGRISVYAPRGQYQLTAETMVPDGAGSLAIAFEQLKAKLGAEGLFDPARKKPIPKHPHRIGVVTSPSGAAIHDIIRVAGGRSPSTEILLFPSAVQGADAPRYLCSGVRYFNQVRSIPQQAVDVIIIGRGGGSAEDLWCFNDEKLARTIASSDIPVISAVGHEVDFSISDFVADLRAATPSAAAEAATPDREDLNRRLTALSTRMDTATNNRLKAYRTALERYSQAKVLADPTGLVQVKQEQFDNLTHRLARSAPLDRILKYKEKAATLNQRLATASVHCVDSHRQTLGKLCGQLEALSPLGVLGRGYTLVQKEDGHLAARAGDLTVGEIVSVRFTDGYAKAEVKEILNQGHIL